MHTIAIHQTLFTKFVTIVWVDEHVPHHAPTVKTGFHNTTVLFDEISRRKRTSFKYLVSYSTQT
jgi:hypothetical protein